MQRDLTDAWLRSLALPATGRVEVWDKRVRGLVLRITPNGTFTWSARARTTDGKRTRPKLGTWPAVGISEARRRALATVADIQRGGDPVADRRTLQVTRLARADLPTVASRLADWQAAKASAWSARYRSEVERVCNREIVPILGNRPLIETTRANWTDVITAVGRRAPGVGAMLYRTCAAFLNHAEAHGWIPLPLLPRKGASIIAPQVAARERTLTDAELRTIWLAADELKPKPRAFVHLLAMTAAREMEVADIATGELDLDAGLWSIPGARTKNGRGIVLPLHPMLVAELHAVWPEHGDRAGPAWKLLGGIAGSGLRGFSPLKRRVDALTGITAWRWHDLRRSARTGLTRMGVSRDHAEAVLNHVSGRSALERTYDRHNFADEVLAALSQWQAHVAALVIDAPKAEVVALRRA
jgi:integrase